MINAKRLLVTIFLPILSLNTFAQNTVVVIPLGDDTKVSSYVMSSDARPVPPTGTGGFETAPTVSTVTVPVTNARVKDINVFIDITHTHNGDLEVSLTHINSNTLAELWTDVGAFGDNTRVQIDDDAVIKMNTLLGVPSPLTGWYKTESGSALDVFNGINPTGTWQLRVADDAGGDIGMLNAWSLEISE